VDFIFGILQGEDGADLQSNPIPVCQNSLLPRLVLGWTKRDYEVMEFEEATGDRTETRA
jgi:hypothetical protein